MGKTQDKSYHSNSVLGKLYDLANDMVIQRIKKQGPDLRFYDGDLKLNNWENIKITKSQNIENSYKII